jgi:hypothetical protein
VPSLIGLIAGVLFIWRELRTSNPALDLRLFRFRPFNAAVVAGAVINFSMGGIVRRHQLLGHTSKRPTFYRGWADSHASGRSPSRCVGTWGLADVQVYRTLNHDERFGDYSRQLLGVGSARDDSIPDRRRGTARAALRIVPAPTEGQLRRVSPIDPEGAHRTVAGSEYAMTHALQTMNLMSGLVPLAALLLVWFWLPSSSIRAATIPDKK